MRPTGILDLVSIHTLVPDHHHRPAIAACHSSEADLAPGSPVPRHPVLDIAQRTPQPSHSLGVSLNSSNSNLS
jgi:hypothetical protein